MTEAVHVAGADAARAVVRMGRRVALTDSERSIIECLRSIQETTESNARRSGLAAKAPATSYSVAAFLLEHGRFFNPPPTARPPGTPKMRGTDCYRSCARLARKQGWLYAEGYAFDPLPIPHAWCMTPEGRVVDPTWGTHGDAYFGVVTTSDAIWRWVADRGTHGLLPEHWRIGTLDGAARIIAMG